jgi:hypothetical protein
MPRKGNALSWIAVVLWMGTIGVVGFLFGWEITR